MLEGPQGACHRPLSSGFASYNTSEVHRVYTWVLHSTYRKVVSGEGALSVRICQMRCYVFISQKVFIMSFFKGQLPHKSVNLFFILVIPMNKLTNICGNRLLQNDLIINTFCEISLTSSAPSRLTVRCFGLNRSVWIDFP